MTPHRNEENRLRQRRGVGDVRAAIFSACRVTARWPPNRGCEKTASCLQRPKLQKLNISLQRRHPFERTDWLRACKGCLLHREGLSVATERTAASRAPPTSNFLCKGGLNPQTLVVERPRETAALLPQRREDSGHCRSTRGPNPLAQGYLYLAEMDATPKAMLGLV